jgi:hypothetical protein
VTHRAAKPVVARAPAPAFCCARGLADCRDVTLRSPTYGLEPSLLSRFLYFSLAASRDIEMQLSTTAASRLLVLDAPLLPPRFASSFGNHDSR